MSVDARAATLRDELATLGVAAEVDADGALALVRLAAWPAGGLAERRAAIVARARACGFTHAALELSDALERSA